mgnify:CR=1 FL=1
MKIVVLTSDGIRHKFFANSLDSKADSSLIISQSKQNDALKDNEPNSINEHFKLRDETEKFFFPNRPINFCFFFLVPACITYTLFIKRNKRHRFWQNTFSAAY